MKRIVEEYGMIIIYAVIGTVTVCILFGGVINNSRIKDTVPEDNLITVVSPKVSESKPPKLVLRHRNYVRTGKSFDPMTAVKIAEDFQGNDIRDNVQVYFDCRPYVSGDIDTSEEGSKYTLRYVVSDREGLMSWDEATVEIRN
ncbi:MAG: hypothetical protein PUB87_04810 [Eubacteriaceae bacterium]|nr:hypothetical protein [Eubacteriaceae bacterium]